MKRLEKKTAGHLAENINSVDGYTVKVSNLPEKNREELRRELWKHFSQISEDGRQIDFNVVDVQLAESQYALDLQIRLAATRKRVKIFIISKLYFLLESQSLQKILYKMVK